MQLTDYIPGSADGARARVPRCVAWILFATLCLLAIFAMANWAVGRPQNWLYQVPASLLLSSLAVFCAAFAEGDERQRRFEGLSAELLDHVSFASKLPLSDYGTMSNVARTPTREGTILIPDETVAMAKLWDMMVRNGWAQRERPEIMGVMPGFAGYLLTDKGVCGLPLMLVPVRKEWDRLATELDAYILEGSAKASPSAPARS